MLTTPAHPPPTAPAREPPSPHPPERLYGRRVGPSLSARPRRLLALTLPRLRFTPAAPEFLARFPALAVEIGFGGGEHAAALLAEAPDRGLIACEIYQNGIVSLLNRLVPQAVDEATHPLPPNLRLWDEDARALLTRLPPASLDLLCLMFPDPWPKTRHAQRRFFGPQALARAAILLKPGAEWRIATDHPVYQSWVTTCLAQPHEFHAPPPATTRPEGWPATRYEAKALREGRQPLYWRLIRH